VCGLVIHLFLRGVWVGYVGLSYAFPAGIRIDRLTYQARYLRPIERIPNLMQQVELLEKLCSSMFATCFFMMMVVLGMLIGILVFIGILYVLDWGTAGSFFQLYTRLFGNNVDDLISVFVAIVAIDFISLGWFRKNKYIAMLYYPLHVFVGWITLSRFYRPIYYTFASNLNRYLLSALLFLFVILITFGQFFLNRSPDDSFLSGVEFYQSGARESFFSGYYSDRNQSWESVKAVIPSPVVTSRFLELTIKHEIRHESHMLKLCGLSAKDLAATGSPKLLSCVNQYYAVYIDGQAVPEPGWMSYFYQKEKRKGFLCFLDTEQLAPGKHMLEVKTQHPTDAFFAQIIFFKE
jgi:hypothetical protein